MDIVRGSLKALNSPPETEGEEPILSTSTEGSPTHVQGEKEHGWTTLLILAAVVTTLGSSVPAGYNIGVVNAPAKIIKAFCNETIEERFNVKLSEFDLDVVWSSVVSIFIIGGIIGSLSGSALADRWGRKGSIIITDIFGLIAGIGFVLSRQCSSIEILLLARFVIGLSGGIATTVVPMYLTELAPLRLRGATGVICPLGLTIGVLFGQVMGLDNVLGKETTWHYLLGFYSLLILVSCTALPILPESPKYLSAVKNEEERAIKELLRIRGKPEERLREEVELLKKENKGETEETIWTTFKVLKDPQLRLPLLLVCALQGGQQFSGINAVFYYSFSIFESAGLAGKQIQYANLGAGAVNLLAGLISLYTVNRFGRRPLILISCAGAILSLCLLTLSISTFSSVSWMAYVAISSVLLYVLVYGLGLGPIPYFAGSELFEVGPRPVGMAFGSMSNWAGNFCVGMTFPSLQNLIGPYSFLIFAAFTICLTLFLIMYFPETKDKDESEIAQLLKFGFKSSIRRISQTKMTDGTESNQLSDIENSKPEVPGE